MINVVANKLTRTCQTSSRREFLQVGTLGVGGLSLASLFSTASRPTEDPGTNKMLLGTIMHTLFDVGRVRLLSSLPKDIQDAVVNSRAIPQLS
jgi:hypothetical protein